MRGREVLVVVVCYNTASATESVVQRMPADRTFDAVFVDDGSTDRTREVLERSGHWVLHHSRNRGLGAAIKSGMKLALDEGYPVVAVMAGNGKDDPSEVPRLVGPILAGQSDYVQGSRFRDGGSHANLPLTRLILVRLHARLIRALTGFPATDAINGFRAYTLQLLKDPRIDIWQDWLDGYEYETYLHYQAIRFGYRIAEVPVSKTYPPALRRGKYSHIRPIIDWWGILRPLVLLPLRLKK